MTKLEFIQSYIDKCISCENNILAESLVMEIEGVFTDEIPRITNQLNRYSWGIGTDVDYMHDVKLLQQKLENYKINLIDKEIKAQRNLETLRLQEAISKNKIQVNAYGGSANSNSTANSSSTVTVEINQIINAINEISPDILSDTNKEELEEKLAAIEVAKISGNKEKLGNKVGNVLKYIADKGIEVGIAVLPYLGEISKLIKPI